MRIPPTDPDVERELVALAHTFAEREIRPVAAELDEAETFPWEVFHAACRLGLASIDIPAKLEGLAFGPDASRACSPPASSPRN